MFNKSEKTVCIIMTAIIFSCSLLNQGCMGNNIMDSQTQSGFYFDTVISITIYGNVNNNIFKKCFDLCEKYENMLSKTIDDSDVARINNARGKSVTVSDDTAYLINKAIYYSRLSNGAYDITIAPLSSLWNFKDNNSGILPDSDDISNALKHVNYQNINISQNTVSLSDPYAQIDLGSIAKGYIADKLKECLLENNIKSAIINLGGNVLAIGKKPDNSDWNIGIQKPFDERNQTIASVSVCDKSVVSSGTYERFFMSDGVLYHHILDTDSGYPVDNGLCQVSIITNSSVDADALSTTCFVLGKEAGIELINSLENTEAVFIDNQFNIIKSDGMDSLYNFTLR